jgi:ribosomal-protein-alanine N-acetyltransferase
VLTDFKDNFTIRQVTKTEADILTRIHEECFPRYWNRQAFTDFFAIENTFAQLVEKSGVPVAMVVYRVTFEQSDMLTLAVIPAWRRNGIAKILMDVMLENCQKLGAKKLFLEVEVGNDHAIKLYEDAGFKHISRRKLYYQQIDGSLTDALVMMKKMG